MSTLPLLEVEDLRTLFHTDGAVAHAVDGISFTVSAGEIWRSWGSPAAASR